MQTAIFKLKFSTAVHFGEGTLDTCALTFMSDTLFSALCIEAVKFKKLDSFVDSALGGRLVLSNAFPFDENGFYLPKPIKRIEHQREQDPAQRKKFKKLQWIPVSDFASYIQGNFNIASHCNVSFGTTDLRTCAQVQRDEGDTEPFHVTTFSFNKGCGLYVLVNYADVECLDLFRSLISSLGFSGIGGKRSSGLGKFTVEESKIDGNLFPMQQALCSVAQAHQGNFMLINVALPREEELEASLEDASYLLVKRSGFINVEDHRAELKKKNIYAFSAGSCFKNTFTGDIYDVSNGYGHSVYRYLKPFFLELMV